jgi:hypothetical protein
MLALIASIIPWAILRYAITGAAIILFLFAMSDIAQSLFDRDRGPYDPLRPSQNVPVTVFQLVIAGVQTVIYTFLIFGALNPLISSLSQVSPGGWGVHHTRCASCVRPGGMAQYAPMVL